MTDVPPAPSERPRFGALLREFRCAAGLSQEALAERARVSSGAISTLERSARRAPQHQTLGLIVEALRLCQEDRGRLEAAAARGRRRPVRGASRPAGAPVPNNLPNTLTSFHGRGDELRNVAQLLQTRRLITLLGPGGVGKTRLALEAARAHVYGAPFPDGVFFIELGPLGAPALVGTAIARTLSVREAPNATLLDTLTSAIGGKRMLVVLDNCEHVLDECARIVERLLRDCGAAVVLTTTREALRVDGECIVRLEPLALAAITLDGPAFRLFADRLTETDYVRYAHLSERDRVAIATICKRLDGIPLALELAAARARDLTLEQIAAGLDERFALLAAGRRTASPRQATLRGIIDWSYSLLTPPERQLFARLGLFASAFTPEAATHVCGENDDGTRDALAGLIAKSLVAVVEGSDGRLRYRLLETVRAYALDRLAEADEVDRYSQRFAGYFSRLAHEADGRYGRIPHADFLAAVEPDLDNFRGALEWTLALGHERVVGSELAGALGWCYRQLSLIAEGTAWCELALASTSELALAPKVVGRLHMALSFFYFNTGELQRALAMAQRAAENYSGDGARSEFVWALTQQAYCLYLLGRAGDATDAVALAVATAREQDDPLRLAGALNAFALTIPVDRAAERLIPLEEAIRAYRAAGDRDAIVPLANLAEAYCASGDVEAALHRGLEVVAITRNNADRSNLAGALTNVAAYALMLGDIDRAEPAALETLHLVRDLGKTLNAMCALQHIGSVHARRLHPVRAARLCGASNRLFAEFGLSREFTERSLYERTMHELREALGAGELERRLREGYELSFEQAIDEALGDL